VIPKDLTEKDLDLAIDSLKKLKIDLTDASRRHLLLLCREAGRIPARPRWLAWIETTHGMQASLASGVVALFLLLLGASWLLVLHRAPAPESPGDAPIQLVSVAPTTSGGVTMEWRDGSQRLYKVLKSTNPRDFRRAETHAVRGTHWTDETPATGGVVYYKVE